MARQASKAGPRNSAAAPLLRLHYASKRKQAHSKGQASRKHHHSGRRHASMPPAGGARVGHARTGMGRPVRNELTPASLGRKTVMLPGTPLGSTPMPVGAQQGGRQGGATWWVAVEGAAWCTTCGGRERLLRAALRGTHRR